MSFESCSGAGLDSSAVRVKSDNWYVVSAAVFPSTVVKNTLLSGARVSVIFSPFNPHEFDNGIGFDPNKSVQKTLRKPAEQIKELMNGGKPNNRKQFASIKSTEIKYNGRGNEHVVILKAW